MVVFVLNVSDRAVPSFQCFISLKTLRELIRFINTQHKHSFSQKKKKPTHTHTHAVEKDMVNFTKLTKQQNRAKLSICIALAAFFIYTHLNLSSMIWTPDMRTINNVCVLYYNTVRLTG